MLRKFISVCVLMLSLCWLPSVTYAQTDSGTMEEFDMPYDDGDLGVKKVSGPLMFYDMGGKYSDTETWSAGKLCFVAEKPGEQIQITFNKFDLSGAAVLYIYDGDIEFYDYNDPVPTTNLLAKLEGNLSDVTYISTTGKMAVLYHCKGSGSGAGWEALVNSVVPKDMEFKGVDVSQANVGNTYPGKKGQPILAVNLRTDGINSPFTAEKLVVSLTGTTDLADLENVQVFSTGSSSSFNTKNPVATSATLEGRLSFDLNRTLSMGDNYFWIAVDVKTSAVPGHVIDAVCESALVAGVDRILEPVAPEGVVEIQNVVLMPSEPTTYTVGDNPISFYDDGGKEGPITENFKGQVTFVPKSGDKKVMIDFTKVELFESSNKNEILNVYNGPTASPENLIMRIMNGQPVKVRSTALGGELTVTLKADTGFPKAGFEATVSQFTPQAMTVDQISVRQDAKGTVSAGDLDRQILSWIITTQDTEPALQVKSFAFSTVDTYAKIKGATVYYTGRSNTFDEKAVKVGHVAVTGNVFEVVADQTILLTEGNNCFWLTYDIDDKAINDDKIDAALTTVRLSDGDHAVEAGSPEGNLVVENICYAELGTTEKTVYGKFLFKSVDNPLSYYNGYDPESGERVVTFVPGTPGMVMELDFSEFELYYSSSSYYAVQARFEVYSGKGTDGELLWKVAGADDAKNGPGRILRSVAQDGALTVVFDTKADGSSSYTAKGFTAEAREYLSVPMELERVNAFQASNGVVKQGDLNCPLIGFKVQTKGDKNPLLFSSAAINLKGAAAQIDKIYLYGGTRDSVFVAETPLATVAAVTAEENVLALPQPLKLNEGESFFWVAVDLKADAAFEQKVDASLISVLVSEKNYTPVVGDPEGECVIKNVYLLQEGNNGVVEVGDYSLMFYDQGGAAGETQKNFKGTVTFVPSTPGQVIKLIFHEWEISGNDDMKFYYGREASGKEAYKYRRTSDTYPIVSKAEDGSLTVLFTSPSYSYKSDGWAIEVQSYTLKELAVDNVHVTAVDNKDLLRGACDVPMLRMDVEVVGDKGNLDLTRLAADFAGSAAGVLAGTRVFTTDTVSSFAPINLYAEAAAADKAEYQGSYLMTEAGVYKFWLAANITDSAAIGSTVNAEIQQVTVAAGTHTPAERVTYTGKVVEGFSGVYTIGEEGRYHTFKEAVEAMKGGIDGPVVFSILPGTYNELVEVPEIKGASDVNTITFQSSTHDYRDVIIASDSYSEPAYSDDKSFYEYGVFTLAGADYVILDGLTLTTGNTQFPSVVHIKNMSRHITVKNCHVHAVRTEDFSSDVNLIYQYAQNLPNHNNDYLTVENCLIEGGYNGVRVAGTSFVSLPKQKGARILNNTFRNQGAKSLYVTGERAMEIKGNIFENTESNKSDFNAVDATTYEGLLVEGNVFHLATPNYATALYLRSMEGSEEHQNYIINNEFRIEGLAGSDPSNGISFGESSYVNIAHNTMRISGAEGLLINSRGDRNNGVICNNILLNEVGGYVYKFYTAEAVQNTAISHNIVYTAGTAVANIAKKEVATFEEWVAASGETDSYAENVAFLSDKMLEPAEAGHLVSGLKLDYVTTDLNGTARAEIPTIGAYEFTSGNELPKIVSINVAGLTESEVTVLVKSSMSGKVYALIQESTADTPSKPDVKRSTYCQDVRAMKEASFRFTGLKEETSYQVFVLAQDLRGNDAEYIMACNPFTTSHKPTEVSTFENVVYTNEGFEDGTAVFNGYSIVEADDCVVTGKKVAKIDAVGSVYISNSTEPLPLTGFYLKAAAPVEISLFDAVDMTSTFTVQPTDGKWMFVSLKGKGNILMLTMSTEGEAYIDNFSGEPQEMFVYVADREVNEGDEVVLDATVSVDRGVAPYTYEWKDRNGKVISTDARLTFTASALDEYYIEVKDAWNQTSDDHVTVRVLGNAHAATFEEKTLEPETHWNGENPEDMSVGKFSFLYSGSYIFSVNKHSDSWWSGFACSNETGSEFKTLNDQYRSAPGGGHNSQNFIVSYVTSITPNYIEVTNKKEGEVLNGFYITNAAYTYESVMNGDAMCDPFAQGDYLKLIVKGKHADKSESTLEYYLADFRSENKADHYCTNTWEWIDLTELGAVTDLTFDFEGTIGNDYGLLTPTYFCMDDFNGEQAVSEGDAQIEGGAQEIALLPYFADFSAEAAAEFTLVSGGDSETMDIRVEGNKLLVNASETASEVVLIRAIQGGKNRLLQLTIHADVTGISAASADDVQVYPVPATDYITVAASWNAYHIEMFSMDGMKVLDYESNVDTVELPVSEYARGSYLLKVTSKAGSVMRRILLVE